MTLAQCVRQPQQVYVEDAPRHQLMALALGLLSAGALQAERGLRKLRPLALAGGCLVALQGAAWASTLRGPFPFAGTDWLATLSQSAGFLAVGFCLCAHARAQGEDYFRGFARALGWLAALLVAFLCFDALRQHFVTFPNRLAEFLQARAMGAPPPREFGSDPEMAAKLALALASGRVSSKFGNPNLLAAALCFLWPWGLALWSLEGRSRSRWLAGGAFGLALPAVLWLTGSRGGLLTFAFAAGLALALFWRRLGPKASLGWIAAAAAGFALGAVLAANAPAGKLASPDDLRRAVRAPKAEGEAEELSARFARSGTIRQRIGFLEVGAAMLRERSGVLGVGAGGYEFLFPEFQPPGQQESQSAHSWALDVPVEAGWLGLLAWVAAAGSAAWLGALAFWRARGESSSAALPVAAACLAGFLALQANGLMELSARQRELSLLAWAAAGAAMALCSREETGTALAPPPRKKSGRALAVGLAATLAGAQILMAWAGWKRLQALALSLQASEAISFLAGPGGADAPEEVRELARIADEWLLEARELFPGSREPLMARARLAETAGRLGLGDALAGGAPEEIAEECLAEALRLYPASPRTALEFARLLGSRRPPDARRAAELVRQAVSSAPNSARTWRQASQAWRSLGLQAEAEAALAKAESLEP